MSETLLREWVWLNHGCPIGVLYGDDGEMQCSNGHLLDFKRMPVDEVLYWLAWGGKKQPNSLEAEKVNDGTGHEISTARL